MLLGSYLIYLYKALRKEGRGGGLILRVRSYKANSCRVCSPHTSKDGSNHALLEKDQSTVQDERSDGALMSVSLLVPRSTSGLAGKVGITSHDDTSQWKQY